MARRTAGSAVLAAALASVPLLAGVPAAQADQPQEALARSCSHGPSRPHCATRVQFVAPTPDDGAQVVAPFTLDVVVRSPEPVALVRYLFRDAAGGLSSANRETATGYALVVDGVLAERLRSTSPVQVQACAYPVSSPDLVVLGCTGTLTLLVG